jgi:hypothetical protein
MLSLYVYCGESAAAQLQVGRATGAICAGMACHVARTHLHGHLSQELFQRGVHATWRFLSVKKTYYNSEHLDLAYQVRLRHSGNCQACLCILLISVCCLWSTWGSKFRIGGTGCHTIQLSQPNWRQPEPQRRCLTNRSRDTRNTRRCPALLTIGLTNHSTLTPPLCAWHTVLQLMPYTPD